ncbi:ferredoxin [Acidihalobacter aeolianus]|uniref:Ferredoxin n=1 Tax=Acidihalobacter aeolianus TaxID=2792603 RepID=A0A1D8K516_9GAMM|nr:(Fe-S)-binding protein [Acidihalobacter aeolianus]AOV16052.1 ferredoxin [Acidihalobacter aeolianus]
MKNLLDWSSYENAGVGDAYADIPKTGGDFAKAVAVCINSRHCEEKPKGVMCPSFRVSDNPLLSTGGRVRLLKAALNSDDVLAAFDERELAEAMDLCLSCKGCKRECENEVDMAMIKIEYLAQRHARHAIPLRTRLFANLPDLLARYPLRSLIALRNRLPLLARLGDDLLGIARQRQLPLPQANPFFQSRQPAQETSPPDNADGRAVVLFVDTFTHHFDPANAHAAIDVLQRAGYRVHVARDGQPTPLCCGRTQLAHGLLDGAKANARRVLAALAPYAEAGMPVIGLEPACLLAIRDDYKFLGLGEIADQVAGQAILFEEFVAREVTAKKMTLDLKPIPEQAAPTMIHGHCHQKAVGAMKSMRKVLKMIPEFRFELVETSCCGMAGSFGLEAEHVEDSLAMAELSLLPALREQPQAAIVANGFSCRHQIAEATDRRPVHIARLLQASVKGEALAV